MVAREDIVNDRCSTCTGRYRCVPGDGPTDARVVCIGEAPGRNEDEYGRPFIGDAGREFNENYLNLAGLYRDEIYTTNTVKCRPDLNRKPRTDEVASCSRQFIPRELAQVRPEVVVLMGATACSMLTETQRVDLEAEHGIPRQGTLHGWSGWIVPMYHPASGLHDTAMMIPLLEDWERLNVWLRDGTWVWPVESTTKDYRLVFTREEVNEYFKNQRD